MDTATLSMIMSMLLNNACLKRAVIMEVFSRANPAKSLEIMKAFL